VTLQNRRKLVLVAAGLSAVTWVVPALSLLTLPIVYLNTHIHELMHALMTLATGGSAKTILVFGDGSGVTQSAGGSTLLIAAAGYIGASAVGAGLIVLGSGAKRARQALFGLAVLLSVGLILWVRGDLIGLLSIGGWIALLFLFGKQAGGPAAMLGVQFLGMQQCFASVQALWVLLGISALGDFENDAQIAAGASGIPGIVWAVAWCGISLLAMVLALRKAWRPDAIRSAS